MLARLGHAPTSMLRALIGSYTYAACFARASLCTFEAVYSCLGPVCLDHVDKAIPPSALEELLCLGLLGPLL
eukprot:8407235-Alexandrium_andersonii.AAC.1